MTDYKQKYLKYKAKYLDLKGGKGGLIISEEWLNMPLLKEEDNQHYFATINTLLEDTITDKTKREKVTYDFIYLLVKPNRKNDKSKVKSEVIKIEINTYVAFIKKIYEQYENISTKLDANNLLSLYKQSISEINLSNFNLSNFNKLLINDIKMTDISIIIKKNLYDKSIEEIENIIEIIKKQKEESRKKKPKPKKYK